MLLPLTAFVGGLEKHQEHIAMSHKTATVAHTIGIDTGKNTLHLIGLDDQGAIVVREKIAPVKSQPGLPMCRAA